MPTWVTSFVLVTLVLLLGWNVVMVGPEGYPTSVILGGLIGAYAGVDQLLKRKADEKGDRGS